jgi:hypothetical protein
MRSLKQFCDDARQDKSYATIERPASLSTRAKVHLCELLSHSYRPPL